MQLAPGLHGISGISANGGLKHLHEVRTWRQFPNILVENVLSQMKWQLRGANNALGNAGQPPLRLKSNIFPVPATRGSHEPRRKQKQGYAARAAQMRLAQMRSAVLRAPFLDCGWGLPEVFAESESLTHPATPPTLLRYTDWFQRLCWEHQPFVQILIFYTYQGSQPWRTVFLQNFALIPCYSLWATES